MATFSPSESPQKEEHIIESPNKCISLPVLSAPQSLARRTFGAHIAAWRNFADCWKNICPPSDAVDKSGYNCTCGGPLKKTHFRKCVQSAQRIFPRDASVYEISRWHQYMCSLAAVPLRGLALRDCKIPEDKTHICQHIWALNIHIHSTLIGTRKLLSSSDWKQSEITITPWNTTRLKWDMFTFTYEHGSVNLSRSWKV